jgi:hypothetical protein
MDDDELIGLDRRCRVFDSPMQQIGEFLGWVALIILTEGNFSAATAIVGGADDLFPSFQKGQFIEYTHHGWARLWLLVWRECGCDPVQLLHLVSLCQDLRFDWSLWC